MMLALSAVTVEEIGPADWADLQRLHDEGWHVEEREFSRRVLAEWEDLGVVAARELGHGPWKWSAWIGSTREEVCYSTGATLAQALAGLAADLQSTAAQVAKLSQEV